MEKNLTKTGFRSDKAQRDARSHSAYTRKYLTGSYSGTFTNSAVLLPPTEGGDTPLAVSKDVNTVVDAKFVKKTGISQNLEGTARHRAAPLSDD